MAAAEPNGGRVLGGAADGSLDVLLDRAACTQALCVRTPFGIAYDDDGSLLLTDPAQHMLLRYRIADGALSAIL